MKINPFVIIFLSSSSSFESVSAETIRRGENVIHRQTNQVSSPVMFLLPVLLILVNSNLIF